jgi:hypothetical protein
MPTLSSDVIPGECRRAVIKKPGWRAGLSADGIRSEDCRAVITKIGWRGGFK